MTVIAQANKELILDSIIGSTEWYGETYHDNDSFTNMIKANELALELIELMYKNATLAQNARDTFSGAKLQTQAKEMLNYIKTICEEVE